MTDILRRIQRLRELEETRSRVGAKRAMLRYSFTFSQEGREVYRGDQSALFVHGAELG